MPEIRRSGRREHELVEIPPQILDCGHPYMPGTVTVGFASESPEAERVRTYRCGQCGAITFSP